MHIMKSKLARQILLTLLLSLVSVSATVTCVTCSRTVPLSQCSDIYRRYAGNPDIGAAYIKDYKLNDSLILSATVLEAKNDSGWATLRKDFNIVITHIDSVALENNFDVLAMHLGTNCNNELMKDEDFAMVSKRDCYLCILQNIEDSRRDQIMDAMLDKIAKALINKQRLIE